MSLIPNVFAAPTGNTATAAHGSPFSAIWILVLFGVFIYFLMWRPQSKRMKQHRDMIGSLKKDDEIITSGGILGKIVKIDEAFITLAIANNSEIVLQKNSISSVLPKGTVKF